MDSPYILTSDRLGLRAWKKEDLKPLAQMNRNEHVMHFFPDIQTPEQSKSSYERFVRHYDLHGFCFFVAETLKDHDWIGFIGLQHVSFEAFFTPAVEVGYRLLPQYWGKGFATEGTKACIRFAFDQLNLERIVSFTPMLNLPSQYVMQRAGMSMVSDFDHPLLAEDSPLKKSVLYEILK
jgi:RimJ/RimL family protein N-acetyltransferase